MATASPYHRRHPAADEYSTYFGRYVARLPAGVDILDVLARQREELLARFRSVPRPRAPTGTSRASGACVRSCFT